MKKTLFLILILLISLIIFGSKSIFSLEKFITKGAITPIACDVGEYSKPGSNACQKCEPGTYQDEKKSDKCLKCDINTYQNKSGASSCLKCPAGKYQNAKGQSSCIDCPKGHYSLEGESCRPCEVGKYNSKKGQSTCILCPAGSYTDVEGQSSCKKCKKGEESNETNTGCDLCPIGKANNSEGKMCKLCLDGKYGDKAGLKECIPCPIGHYEPIGNPAREVGSHQCKKCQKGTFSANVGKNKCDSCPVGHYQDKEGQISCLKCGLKNETDENKVYTYSNDESSINCKDCPTNEKNSAIWKTSQHASRCELNLLKENWTIDSQQIRDDEEITLDKDVNNTYKPLLMGSTVVKKNDININTNKFIGNKKVSNLNIHEISIISLKERQQLIKESDAYSLIESTNKNLGERPRYPNGNLGFVTMRLYPRYFIENSIIDPTFRFDRKNNRENQSENNDSIGNVESEISLEKEKIVVSFDIRKSENGVVSGAGVQPKSTFTIKWGNGDNGKIVYCSDSDKENKYEVSISDKWERYVFEVIEGNKDQLANGVDFIFNEENQCKYQIANLKIESYSDLKTDSINFIDNKYGVYNQNPPNGIEGVCPVGPWNLRVSDGCCVSQLTEVKGISDADTSLDTFNSLNQASNVWDENDARESCDTFGWNYQDNLDLRVNAYTCCKTNDYRAPLADSIILNGITFVIGDSFCIPLSKLSKNVYGKQPFLKVKDENGIEVFVENLIWDKYKNKDNYWSVNVTLTGDPSKAFATIPLTSDKGKGKVAYLIYNSLVYKIIRDKNNQVANINELEPMKNVVNVGGDLDSNGEKIPIRCCNPAKSEEDAYLWSPDGRLPGRMEIKNVVDRIKLEYPDLKGNRLNEKIEEELQSLGNFQKCMDKEHRIAKSNAIESSSDADLILSNRLDSTLSFINDKKNTIKSRLQSQKQNNLQISNEVKRKMQELENNRKLLEKRNMQNLYYNRETPQPTQ